MLGGGIRMKKNSKLLIFLTVLTAFMLFSASCSNGSSNDHTGEHTEGMNHEKMDHKNMNDHAKHNGKDSQSTKNQDFSKAPAQFNPNAEESLIVQNTKNITRIPVADPIRASIYVSQTIWPATHKENQPGAVILSPVGQWQTTLAGADLIHHPNNGPILLIHQDNIPDKVLSEIKRLNPTGNRNGTQIVVLGDVSNNVINQLSGYKIEQIKGKNPAEFARNVDQAYAEVSEGYPESVIIVSSEDQHKLYSIPAVNWISHMPEPILFAAEHELPKETKDALKKRNKKANIYILGPEKVISKDVENQLKEYGTVHRIAGNDPVTTSIEFAKFKDKDTQFGWGITEPGHGVSFISTDSPELALAAAPFSHLGKHAPMIWLNKGQLQQETYDFLASIKPTFQDDPTTGPYNHGFIIGDQKQISFQTQGILDDKLEIAQEDGHGHGGH